MDYKRLNIRLSKSCSIKINRPEVLNSFNKQMAKEFLNAGDARDNKSRSILIAGEGKAFSAERSCRMFQRINH